MAQQLAGERISYRLGELDGVPVLMIAEESGKREVKDLYRFERIPSQFGGKAVRLHKLVEAEDEPVCYAVLVGGKETLCDCPGEELLRARNSTNRDGSPKHCKHIRVCQALKEDGEL